MAETQPVPRAPLTWADGPSAGTLLIAIYAAAVLLPLALSLADSTRTGEPFLVELSLAAAMTGFAILALQTALGSRLRLAERPFGLDITLQFHKGMAITACVLLLSHPCLLALNAGSARLFSLQTGWRVNLGKISLVLLLLTALAAFCWRLLRVDYRIWRFAHKGAILAVVFGFIHGLVIGDDIRFWPVRLYWWSLLVLSVGLFLYRNFLFPLFGRRRFTVTAVERAALDAWTLTLSPKAGESIFPYHPGQFMFLKLLRKGFRAEEHPFTIASSPAQEGSISATIRESGDFTRTIGKTLVGDTALVEAPFGQFSLAYCRPERFLFIAGGAGITPIMSMLRYLRDTGDTRPATLLYANRDEESIIFRDELEGLPERVKVVHVLSAPAAGWQGERGFVTRELIKSHAGSMLSDAHIFLCGPPAMMKSVIRMLRGMGVPGSRIHWERFAI